MIARELEARLRADLRDEAAWTVYADWLASQGDSRGELIGYAQRAEREADRDLAEQWRARAKQLFEREHQRWLGPLRKARIKPTWFRGFVTEAVVHDRPRWTAETLLGSRTGALLYRLGFVRLPDCRPVAAALSRSWIEIVELRSLDTTRVEPLADIEGLRELSIERSQVDDLAALATLPALERLLMDRTECDLDAFERGFEALRHLAVSNLGRRAPPDADEIDLRGLSQLPGLEILELRGSRITNLGPLARLPKLRQLDISDTPVRSLDPLEDIATLERVDAAHCSYLGSRESLRLLERGVHVELQSLTSRLGP